MFRVVLPPIIRSAYNYLQHLVFVTPLLLSAAIVEVLELVWVCFGWRTPVLDSWWWTERPSETCRVLKNKINLRYCAYGWFYYRNREWEISSISFHLYRDFFFSFTVNAAVLSAERGWWFSCSTYHRIRTKWRNVCLWQLNVVTCSLWAWRQDIHTWPAARSEIRRLVYRCHVVLGKHLLVCNFKVWSGINRVWN
jgi:hypothetical protein